jgi:hypothetical protein
MGLTLHQASQAPIPESLQQLMAATYAVEPRPIYTDGSFAVDALLLASLTQSPADFTSQFAVAATGVYLPQANGAPAVALRFSTPIGSASDAYYQELLGISLSMLLSRATPLIAYSDCSSAIARAHQSRSLLGPAVGHLQHGALLLGIRALLSSQTLPLTLTWTPLHPERLAYIPTPQASKSYNAAPRRYMLPSP